MIVHELFNLLCFQFRMVSVEYFMDKMEEWEISDICDCLPYADRQLWEMTRFIMYQNIQMNTKKTINIQDILKFKWENEIPTTDKEIATEDIQRMRKKSAMIFQQIQQADT